jgi:hypothetical protein
MPEASGQALIDDMIVSAEEQKEEGGKAREKNSRFSPMGLMDFFGVTVLAILALRPTGMAGDPGVGWHLRSGEWIIATGSIPHHDPFNEARVPWVHNQWLADVLEAFLYKAGSWPFVELGAIGLIMFFLMGPLRLLVSDARASTVPTFMALAVVGILSGAQWILRPVLFSFLLFAFLVLRLKRRFGDAEPRSLGFAELLAYGMLFFVWVQLHPGFAIGIVYQFALLAGLIWAGRYSDAKDLAYIIVISLVATFANPYGVELHRSMLSLLRDEYFMNLNVEWQSPNFRLSFFYPFLGAIALLLLLLSFSRARLSSVEAVPLAIFLCLSLISRRYIPFFAIVLAHPLALLIDAAEFPAILRPLKQMSVRLDKRRQTSWLYSMIFFGVLLVATVGSGRLPGHDARASGPDEFHPEKALDIIKDRIKGASGIATVFSTPDWGGYIIYRLSPFARPWIDDRNEMHGKEKYQTFFRLWRLSKGWRDDLSKLNAEFFLLAKDSPFAEQLTTEAGWKQLYSDETVILFEKEGSYGPGI